MSSSIISQQSTGLATDTQSGLVGTGAQAFAGNKTFNGQILTPNRPVFNVASNVSAANNTQQTYNKVYTNVGSAFSIGTSRFTAPISGTYYFEWATIKQASNTIDVHRQHIRVNGSIVLDNRHLRLSETSNYGDGSCSAIINLNQNDYVDIYIQNSTIGSHASYEYTWFHGYLIG
jgi:virulence-associated protein VapD